jgi:hypothetical protein
MTPTDRSNFEVDRWLDDGGHFGDSYAQLGHDDARRRLDAALAEQRRSRQRDDAATGRFAKLAAEVSLHAADQEVAARDRWLKWVDDEGYHGLNAGPFDLRCECERDVDAAG